MVREHWERLLGNAKIDTVLDCSIGTGNLTLQLAELGKKVTGSDLNPVMLNKCRQKAQEKGVSVELFSSDLHIFVFLYLNKRYSMITILLYLCHYLLCIFISYSSV